MPEQNDFGSREAAAAYDITGEVAPPATEPAEPTEADIAANRVKLQELRDRVDRLITPKAIVLSGYTVLGLAMASVVKRDTTATEQWEAAREKAEEADELFLAEPPASATLEFQDVAAGVEVRLAEALHEVVKAMTMQAAAEKGSRAGLEKLMAQLMTDMDVLTTKARSNELKLGALRHIADPDALALAELVLVAALSDEELDCTTPADNDADLAEAIGDSS